MIPLSLKVNVARFLKISDSQLLAKWFFFEDFKHLLETGVFDSFFFEMVPDPQNPPETSVLEHVVVELHGGVEQVHGALRLQLTPWCSVKGVGVIWTFFFGIFLGTLGRKCLAMVHLGIPTKCLEKFKGGCTCVRGLEMQTKSLSRKIWRPKKAAPVRL